MQHYSYHNPLHDEIRERAKLEGNHFPAEDEHSSQPSTMHSLGNLEDHFSASHDTPTKSPEASHFGHHVNQEIKEQASNIKSMLTRTFGEKVDTYKDNSENIKQQVGMINQEIKQLPKRDEEVVEAEGHRDLNESDKACGMIDEMRDRVARYATGLNQQSKEQLNKLHSDIKQLPHNEERIVEGQGQGKEQEIENKDNKGEDLWSIAFNKIEEMKRRAQQKGQEFKNLAQTTPQKTYEHHESHQSHPHHHLSVESQSFQPSEHSKILAETVQEGLKDSSVPLLDKIEEVENQWKHDHEEQQPEREQESPQKSPIEPKAEQKEEVPVENKRESEQEIQPKPEEKLPEKEPQSEQSEQGDIEKPQEREALLDKVLNKIHAVSDNIHNTVEGIRNVLKIEESGPEIQKDEGEQPLKREPLVDKVLNKIHAVSDNIHHTVADIRDALHIDDPKRERQQEEAPEEEAASRGRIMEGIHSVTDMISHNIENAKSRIASAAETVRGRLRKEPKQSEGFHRVKTGFSKSIKEYTQETRPIMKLKSHNPFQALSEDSYVDYDYDEGESKIMLLAGKIRERFEKGMKYMKSKLAFKRKGTVKKVKQEQQKEKQSLKKQIRQGLEALSSRIAQNIESLKGRLRPNKEAGSNSDEELEEEAPQVEEKTQVQPEETQLSESVPAQSIKKSKKSPKAASKAIQSESSAERSHVDVKKEESWEGFQDISDGFSQSVREFEKGRRGSPVVSSNPFDSLSGRNMGQSTKKTPKRAQLKPIRENIDKENQPPTQKKKKNKPEFHKISDGVYETVEHFQKELRGPPVVSRNPFSSLYTPNMKSKGKALLQKAKRNLVKAKGDIRKVLTREDKENEVPNTFFIWDL